MAYITDNGQLLNIVILSWVTCLYPNTVSENITYKSKSSNAQLKIKKYI